MKWFRRKVERKDEESGPRFAPIGGTRTGPVPPRPTVTARPAPPTPAAPAPVPEPDRVVSPPAVEPRAVTAAEVRQAEFALAEGIVTRDFLGGEIQRADAEATPLGRALLGLDYPEMSALAGILGRIAIPRIDLDKIGPAEDALDCLPAEIARARDCLPLAVFGNIICVAMARPEDLAGIREIRNVTGRRVKALRAEGTAVRALIARHYAPTAARRFRLRPLPISPETFDRALGRNRRANDLVTHWESVWLHGAVCPAEPMESAGI